MEISNNEKMENYIDIIDSGNNLFYDINIKEKEMICQNRTNEMFLNADRIKFMVDNFFYSNLKKENIFEEQKLNDNEVSFIIDILNKAYKIMVKKYKRILDYLKDDIEIETVLDNNIDIKKIMALKVVFYDEYKDYIRKPYLFSFVKTEDNKAIIKLNNWVYSFGDNMNAQLFLDRRIMVFSKLIDYLNEY